MTPSSLASAPRCAQLWPVLALLALTACSTPKHTNVLIFGTNTKVALDVSQDPTGGVGVTLGYKREEAVWMPLLPNQADGPLKCHSVETVQGTPPKQIASPKCDKYVGTHGSDTDTYSVLASFGANLEGKAVGTDPSAQAKGSIAQYFATGWAARALAERGGAALVNSSELPLSPDQRVAVAKLVDLAQEERQVVLAFVRDTNAPAKIDTTKMQALLAKATGTNAISDLARARFTSATTIDQLTARLTIHDTDAAKLAPLAK